MSTDRWATPLAKMQEAVYQFLMKHSGLHPEDGQRVSWRKVLLACLHQPVRYVSVSVIVFLCDTALFLLLHNYVIYGHEKVSYVLGRVFGAAVGYILNRRMVFRFTNIQRSEHIKSLLQYTVLVAVNTTIGLGLMQAAQTIPHVFPYLAKLMADTVLYVTTFLIQRNIVFKRKNEGQISD